MYNCDGSTQLYVDPASGCSFWQTASLWDVLASSKLVVKGSTSFGRELQMEALAPFLDCGPAVWLLEEEVMNKLCQSSCLGRTSSLECKQGWREPFSSSQNIADRSERKREKSNLMWARSLGWFTAESRCVTFFCDNSDLWSRTVPDITTHITDGHKLKKGTTCIKQKLMWQLNWATFPNTHIGHFPWYYES